MTPKASQPFTFDPDGDLVLVLTKLSKTPKAASQKAGKLAAGQLEVELPEDDQAVMIIVLNIIHGRNRVVPKRIDLNMLTNLAILVDKYQMVEVVESFSHSWIDHLLAKVDLPDGFPEDNDSVYQQMIHQWLAISWVFRRKDEFKNITKAAIICCDAKLAEEVGSDLPIPGKVIESIAKKREANITKCLDIVKETIDKYQGSDRVCIWDYGYHRSICDATILGSLIKSMVSYRIWPIPEPPYDNFNFSEVSATIDGLLIMSSCDIKCRQEEKGHGIPKLFQEKVASIEGRLTGLDIKTFKR